MPSIHYSADATFACAARSSASSQPQPTAVSGSSAITIPTVAVSYGPSVPTAIATIGLDVLSATDAGGDDYSGARTDWASPPRMEIRQPNFSDSGTYDFGGSTR